MFHIDTQKRARLHDIYAHQVHAYPTQTSTPPQESVYQFSNYNIHIVRIPSAQQSVQLSTLGRHWTLQPHTVTLHRIRYAAGPRTPRIHASSKQYILNGPIE